MVKNYDEFIDPIGSKEAAKIMGCDMSYIRLLIKNKRLNAVRNPDNGHWGIERLDAVNFKFSDDPRGRKRKSLTFKQLSWTTLTDNPQC